MPPIRSLGLIALAVLLAACDKPESDKASTRPVAPVEQQQRLPVDPEAAPAVPQVEPEPAEVPAAEQPPAAKQELPESADDALKVTEKILRNELKVRPSVRERAPLDLSLHPNVFDPLQPRDQDESKPNRLLPPLFEEKPEAESPFQLNGKLITNDHLQGDYWDTVEGAQLNFEFKQ